jgi:hypothetical protein
MESLEDKDMDKIQYLNNIKAKDFNIQGAL